MELEKLGDFLKHPQLSTLSSASSALSSAPSAQHPQLSTLSSSPSVLSSAPSAQHPQLLVSKWNCSIECLFAHTAAWLVLLVLLLLWGWGLRTDRVHITLSQPCTANLFFNNNNNYYYYYFVFDVAICYINQHGTATWDGLHTQRMSWVRYYT